MPRPAFLAVALIVLLGTATRGGGPPVRSAAASQPLTARDVTQPEGWDKNLTLPPPQDLSPDPKILEFNLEARIASIEITPGAVTAMAQGHYPLSFDSDKIARLRPSPDMPALVDVKDSAVQRLVRRTVLEAEQLVSEIMLPR